MKPAPFRPSKADLQAARGKTLPDLVSKGLRVLFVGINPGLYTAAIGHHFGRPGNRFWPALHRSGLTPRQLSPFEERELLDLGLGITNLVSRTTAVASELSEEELEKGARSLARKVGRLRPKIVAFLGLDAYRRGFGRKKASIGLQPERLGEARVWVLPNTSGLNANHQLPDFVRLFRELKRSAEKG